MVRADNSSGVLEGEVGVCGVGEGCRSELMCCGRRNACVFDVHSSSSPSDGEIGTQSSEDLCTLIG